MQWQKRAVGGLAAGSGGDPHWCVAGAGAPQAREQGIYPFLKEYILLLAKGGLPHCQQRCLPLLFLRRNEAEELAP